MTFWFILSFGERIMAMENHIIKDNFCHKKELHPKLDLVTTRFSELHNLVNKSQLPSYFIIYHYSI